MKKKVRAPKYAYGVDQITDAIGAGLNMIGNAAQGNQVTASSVLSGMAGGAIAGSQFGLPGAIVGGGLGLVTSAIGTGGSVNEQTGEVVNPSGIAGLFGHSKRYLQNRGAKIKNGIQARSNAEQIAANYYMDNGYNDLSLAKGGVVPSTIAYLDDGELIRTPDGTIGSIPEEGKPTDSNLLNVPVGTQVLSDKIKVPGTNKTFAEMGKKLMKKTKDGGDIYAQNSKMLNERNNQIAYQQLLNQQEALKKKKIRKNNDNIPAYADGRDTQDFSRTPIAINAPIGNVQSANDRGSYFSYTGDPGKIDITSELVNPDRQISNRPRMNYSSILSNLSSLVGPIGNMLSGSPERVDTYTYDPVYGPSEYDIDPLLRQISSSDAIARYNMANINPNTGANMAFGLQSAVTRNNAMANAYSQKNNAENQMAFNNAQIANQWGQQYANARHVAAVEQAQNDATARNIRRKGLGDLSTRLQAISKDKRLTNRDQAMLNAMRTYLDYGMTSQQLSELYSKLSYGS